MQCAYCGIPFTRIGNQLYCGVVCQIMSRCSGASHRDRCWVWMGAKRENGYGLVRVKIGRAWQLRTAARAMYAAHFGEVPRTQSVLQTCGTKNCCNPLHLKLGVQELHLGKIAEIAP